jgi:periplasmic protein TonB
MFSDLAVAHGVPVRRWVPLVSFSLQAAMVAVALIYPLLRLEPLPSVIHPMALPVIGDTAPVHPASPIAHGSGTPLTQPIIVHNYRPSIDGPVTQSPDTMQTTPPNIGVVGVGDRGGLPDSILNGYAPTVPVAATHPQNIRTSVMMEGNLIHKVEPQYPAMAKRLTYAALEAVRQWRYRPYYLNNEPVEVETEITVNFVLQNKKQSAFSNQQSALSPTSKVLSFRTALAVRNDSTFRIGLMAECSRSTPVTCGPLTRQL